MITVNKENANKIRAGVISSALEVEDALTLVLGHWYCPSDKDNEMVTNRLVEDVLADLTFDKKIKLFKGFVDNFPEEFPTSLIKDLNDIRETRNQMAHRVFHDPSEMAEFYPELDLESLNEFHFLKIGKTSFTFTLADLGKYEQLCRDIKYLIYFSADKIVRRLK
jgi:hypothetical protein